MLKRFVENNEMVIDNYEDACAIQKILIKNEYAVMMTREDEYWILNWAWCSSGEANRNDMVFIGRDIYNDDWNDFCGRHPEIKWSEEDDD